ncbi:hypothetical protein A0H81_10524 [Grifola frondosa]|uniref:Uncharacterized protein n=1 Tax=Grifola frondosa TaxID=5627 RepID=A0A1C7M479_GRIFR|nr:hypothetical protein A0H81_10524 [Grifola frondosa]
MHLRTKCWQWNTLVILYRSGSGGTSSGSVHCPRGHLQACSIISDDDGGMWRARGCQDSLWHDTSELVITRTPTSQIASRLGDPEDYWIVHYSTITPVDSMAVPANCNNCANDPSIQDGGQEAQANLGVVVGVLGGMWLVGVVVLIVVPLVRRRNRRRARDIMRSKGDIDSGYQPSRRSSFRHQKMFSGPDAHVLLPLLDPLRPVSTLTWSDLHSRSLSIDSTDGGDTYVSPTNNATTSHRSPGEQPPVMGRGEACCGWHALVTAIQAQSDSTGAPVQERV